MISEAIRTVYPGVLSGCYLEDEIPETVTVKSESMAALPEPYPVESWIQAIQKTDTLDGLREVWSSAIKGTPSVEALGKLIEAKDAKKKELSND